MPRAREPNLPIVRAGRRKRHHAALDFLSYGKKEKDRFFAGLPLERERGKFRGRKVPAPAGSQLLAVKLVAQIPVGAVSSCSRLDGDTNVSYRVLIDRGKLL